VETLSGLDWPLVTPVAGSGDPARRRTAVSGRALSLRRHRRSA